MTRETRLKMAKLYASLDEKGKQRQHNLKVCYDEFKEELEKPKKISKGD